MHRFSTGLSSCEKSNTGAQWIEDYKLINYEGLFEEYLEMGNKRYEVCISRMEYKL